MGINSKRKLYFPLSAFKSLRLAYAIVWVGKLWICYCKNKQNVNSNFTDKSCIHQIISALCVQLCIDNFRLFNFISFRASGFFSMNFVASSQSYLSRKMKIVPLTAHHLSLDGWMLVSWRNCCLPRENKTLAFSRWIYLWANQVRNFNCKFCEKKKTWNLNSQRLSSYTVGERERNTWQIIIIELPSSTCAKRELLCVKLSK